MKAHSYNATWAREYNLIFIPFLENGLASRIPRPEEHLFYFHGGYGTVHQYIPHQPQPSMPLTYKEIADMITNHLGKGVQPADV